MARALPELQDFLPVPVGSYERVARELARYVRVGYRKFILDIPPTREELDHIHAAFELAERGVLA